MSGLFPASVAFLVLPILVCQIQTFLRESQVSITFRATISDVISSVGVIRIDHTVREVKVACIKIQKSSVALENSIVAAASFIADVPARKLRGTGNVFPIFLFLSSILPWEGRKNDGAAVSKHTGKTIHRLLIHLPRFT